MPACRDWTVSRPAVPARPPGFENVPVLMLTGLDDDASITRAYQAGATDFFVKSNQWSLLDGRLRYLLRASRTRQELERSKSKLARAQDLARMGSFDWRRQGGLSLSAGGAARLRPFRRPTG
jgi:PleD family two-component response regulator